VLCTGAPGILERVEDPSSVISYTDIKGLKRLRDAGQPQGRHAAQGGRDRNAIRGGVRRVHVISYKSADSLLAEIFTNEGTGTLVVADLKALSPAEQLARSERRPPAIMTGSGTRELRSMRACSNTPRATTICSTIGWCLRHPRLDRACGDARRARACCRRRRHHDIRDALSAIGEEHAQGKWRITLEQEDCQTAIENLLTARIGAAGGRLHAGRSRNDQVLAALRLYMRDAARSLQRGAIAVAEALDALRRARRRHRAARLHPHAAGHAEQRGAVGGGSPRRFATMPRACELTQRRIGKNPWDRPPATARRISRRAAKPRAALDFAVTHEPVTAVQLSRGKAERSCCSRSRC
jgi:hypothetical protein